MVGHQKGSDEFGHLPEYRGATGTPRGVKWASCVLGERGRGSQGWPRAPSPSSPNWTRKGGWRPPFLPPLPSFLPSYSYYWKEGILFLVGVGRLLGCAIEGRPLPLLHSSIYGGGGTP